jgi:hypothetical protein
MSEEKRNTLKRKKVASRDKEAKENLDELQRRFAKTDARRVLPSVDWVAKIDDEHLKALGETQTLAVSHFYTGLVRLRDSFSRQVLLPPEEGFLPKELTGTLQLPDGKPAEGIAVTVQPFKDKNGVNVIVVQTTVTDANGYFRLNNLPNSPVINDTPITLHFRGSNGSETRTFIVSQFMPLGIIGNVTLKLGLTSLPKSVVGGLLDIVSGLDRAEPEVPRPGTVEQPISVTLGDEGCPITFSHDLPIERFRYSILIRLVEPRASILTEVLLFRGLQGNGLYVSALRNKQWANIPGAQRSFTERVPIDQPISVDGFRDRITGNMGGIISGEETVPMAGTLGLGYTVHLAQQWKPVGLSLGDLVYSLPLAPGEQQRIAVFEQRQTLSTAEFEALDYDEQQHQRQQSDSSTQAAFNSAFAESVRGSSSFSTSADSSSWGVAGGIGAAIGPVLVGIGAGGGGGSSSSSGSSSNSLDGSRNYVSTASSQAHNSVEREAAARRHAQRTGMRLATASDVEQVTTKVITNNNRAHALTMQYWEVLRHFEVSTVVDGVTLVCFVPLEVIRFLPPGVSITLVESEVQIRDQIIYRYSQLLKHPDVLRRWLPLQYRQGLNILEEFASNPRAIPSFNSTTEEIIHFELTGSFLPMEDIFVEVLTRRNTRIGPVRLTGTIPPLPDTVTDPSHAFTSKTGLMAELRQRRAPDQNITLKGDVTLPSSINPDDVVGFDLTRIFRTLQYQLAPTPDDAVQKLIASGNFNSIFPIFPIFQERLQAQVNGVILTPTELEQELGGPSIWGFSARTTGVPTETYASNFISAAARMPMPADGFPVPAQAVSPLLKFNELLKIEQALQHVVRNTITYSRAVWMSLTPEERAIMLEGFTIGVPSDGIPDATQHIPLLNCIANQVLGFYGNSMIMPFNIPAEVSTRVVIDGNGGDQRPFTSAEVQNALTRFHRTGFSSPVSHLTLPTQGVIGEAVLGKCPSAEKVDLTRFWNWGDSPIPQAADIAGNILNKGSTLIGATAPSTLTGLPTMITNVNAPPADSADALKALIGAQNTKDLPDITGMQQLATLQGKTLDTAEKARADALARAQTLATEGLNKAGDIMKAKAEAAKSAKADEQKAKADEQKAKTDQEKARTSQLQTAVADMRSHAAAYLAVADSKADQDAADAYAQQIINLKFGSDPVPVDTASTLFGEYRKFKSGNSGPLTQGSSAFLKALGIST